MPQQTRTFAIVSEGFLGRMGIHISPLTPTKSALTLGRASAMCESDAQKGSHGREPTGGYKRELRQMSFHSNPKVLRSNPGYENRWKEISSYCPSPASV